MWAPHQYFWKFCVDGSCWRSPQMPFWVPVMIAQPSLLNAASFSFHSHFSSPVTFVIQVLLVSGISEPDPDLGSWITSYKFTGLPSSQLRYLTNTRMTSKMPKSLPPSAKTVIKLLCLSLAATSSFITSLMWLKNSLQALLVVYVFLRSAPLMF